jgi:hypothetical protein
MMKPLYGIADEQEMRGILDPFMERHDPRPWHDGARRDAEREAMERHMVVFHFRLARAGAAELGFTLAHIMEQFIIHTEATYGKRVSASQLQRWERLDRYSLTTLIPGVRLCSLPRMRQVKLPSRARLIPDEHAHRIAGIAAKEAARREAIIFRWDRALLGGKELGFKETQCTRRFIRIIRDRFGLVVSRATLYLWRRRYRRGGLTAAALIDGRKVRYSRQQSDQSRGIEGCSLDLR